MVVRKKSTMGLAALAGETARMAKTMMVLDKTEAALERELDREEHRVIPKSRIGKVRRRGEGLLHAKYVLLMIVVLNVVDCLLVLGELMLDIKYVTDLLSGEYERSEGFVGTMKGLYPARLGYLQPSDIIVLQHELTIAHITWDQSVNQPSVSRNISDVITHKPEVATAGPLLTVATSNVRQRRASATGVTRSVYENGTVHYHAAHAHSIEEKIAHALHKSSITILGILVIVTIVKIFCLGKEMLEHKLECFDSFIVVVSFIVDLVFLKGLQQFAVQEFVLILAFMVPWRIIRVVNSLVVAIMDHEHFRLKILYKQKKKISNELKEMTTENKGLQACIDALEKMCASAGIPDTHVKAKLDMYRKVQARVNVVGALSNFALGGDVINKPFTNGILPKSDVSVTIEDRAYKTADKLDQVLDPPTSGDDSRNNNDLLPSLLVDSRSDTERPRSWSAIEYTDNRKSERDELVKKLAENSAGFIATINKDEYDSRGGIAMLKDGPKMADSDKKTQDPGVQTDKTGGQW